MTPPGVADLIKRRGLLGYRAGVPVPVGTER